LSKSEHTLVISGGGAKGAFSLGCMIELYERGLLKDVDRIVGTSVGALNSCYVFCGIERLEAVWRSIKSPKDIIKSNWWKGPFMDGLYSTKPLKKKLDYVTSFDVHTKNIEAICTYVDLRDLSLQYASSKQMDEKNYAKFALASASIPFAMSPVDKYLVDGGAREIAPLKDFIHDSKKITVISNKLLCNDNIEEEPWDYSKFLSVLKIGLRSSDAQSKEIFLDDLCRLIDDIDEDIEFNLYVPEEEKLSTLDFYPEKIDAGIEHGKEIVRKALA